ncbi:hypothetical protein E2542_SST18654 [Spatholobus suberectus]|nr:hypothetical protein E2542_SST18654 [Spatholobus suberectus]
MERVSGKRTRLRINQINGTQARDRRRKNYKIAVNNLTERTKPHVKQGLRFAWSLRFEGGTVQLRVTDVPAGSVRANVAVCQVGAGFAGSWVAETHKFGPGAVLWCGA